MEYPIKAADVTAAARRLLDADGLTHGDVPGFEVAPDVVPGAVPAAPRQEFEIKVSSISALDYDDVHELLDQKVGWEFVAATASQILAGAEELPGVTLERWDYSQALSAFHTPPFAIVFPWWRAEVGSLPRVDGVAVLGSCGVREKEAIWVESGSGKFALNSRGGVRWKGSESDVVLVAEVWRLGQNRPRIRRVRLLDNTIVDR